MKSYRLFATTAAWLVVQLAQPANAAQFTFQGLGDLPGGAFASGADGISADGSVVIGTGTSASGSEAFRWTSGGGIVGLGDLSGGTYSSHAWSVSADGSAVVGWGNSSAGTEAFRWTSASGMVSLGDLPGGTNDSRALGVSVDGSVVVGSGTTAAGTEAFRWTTSGMAGMGFLPGGSTSAATGISADGSVVVGFGNSGSKGQTAFRWTSGTGMTELGTLPGGNYPLFALAMSADGTAIVGETISFKAFVWTDSSGLTELNFTQPSGVSDDGAVVVGTDITPFGSSAIVWTANGGVQKLQDVLVACGASGLTGWTLVSANGVSADGRTIVGTGINPEGNYEAWIATVPEPRAAVLLVSAATCLAFYCAKVRRKQPVRRK